MFMGLFFHLPFQPSVLTYACIITQTHTCTPTLPLRNLSHCYHSIFLFTWKKQHKVKQFRAGNITVHSSCWKQSSDIFHFGNDCSSNCPFLVFDLWFAGLIYIISLKNHIYINICLPTRFTLKDK